VHLRFVKGLSTPYALARAAMDRDIQANYPASPSTAPSTANLWKPLSSPAPAAAGSATAPPPGARAAARRPRRGPAARWSATMT